MFIPLRKRLFLLCSLDHCIIVLKNTLTFSHLKFQNRGLNLHAQNCRKMLTRQRELVEMEEARGIAKRSSMERDCTVAQGSVSTFYVMFLSWGPLLLWVLGKLVIEDKLTYCGVLALLLQEFEMSKRAALILVVIVVVNNIILIIMLVWEGLGTS